MESPIPSNLSRYADGEAFHPYVSYADINVVDGTSCWETLRTVVVFVCRADFSNLAIFPEGSYEAISIGSSGAREHQSVDTKAKPGPRYMLQRPDHD